MRSWIFPEARPPGDGPWVCEPDKAQWVDEATDLDCLIVRNRSGALCGYVGVPPGHPWHGQDYERVDADVHGGLTFASLCHEGGEDGWTVCHIPEPGRPANVWWLGFDCAHAGDLCPKHEPTPGWRWPETYRDFGYVQGEIRKLAAQARQVAPETGAE